MRAAWRHEQLSVRMALAAAQHHSAPKCAGPETHEAPRGQMTARAAAGAQLFCLDVDEAPAARGSRPDRLAEVRPQERVQRHTVEQIVAAPLLDVPVPQLEEQLLLDVFRPHDRQVPELVIEVPKIICEDILTRSSVPEPQLVEQLVDVPTVLSVAVLQQRTAAAREEEEMEELLAVPPRLRTAAQWARLRELIGASSRARRRKKKKRRKRKLPLSPRPLVRGRVRRQQWQWHSRYAGFPGDVSPRAVFLRSRQAQMRYIMAVLDQKDSYVVAGFTGYVAPRAVFLSVAIPQVQFLSRLSCPLCATTNALVQTRSSLASSQVLLLDKVLVPTVEIPQVQFLDMVICPLSSQTVEEPQLIAWFWYTFLRHRDRYAQCKLCSFLLLFINKVVYIPVAAPTFSHGPDCLSDHRNFPVATW